MGLLLFGAVGRIVYALPLMEKKLTKDHLRLIYSATHDQQWINRTARQVYYNIGKNAFDAVWLSQATPQQFNRVVTWDAAELEKVKVAHAKGRGVVIITSHLGCFELILQIFSRQGMASFAVGQRLYDERLDAMVRDLRSGPNIAYLYRNNSARDIVRFLQEGRLFCVLVDQDTAVDSLFAPFLGVPAYSPFSAVKMALRFNVPAFVATTARQRDNTHRYFIEGPLSFERSDNEQYDLARGVAMANAKIGATIQQFPEQWVWMHRRWRRRPDDPAYSHIVNVDAIANTKKQPV